MATPLWTLGHGALAEDELTALVASAGIATVVDVRRRPGSRRHPQYRRAAMQRWLPEAGVGYRWVEALGGHRDADADSPNVALDEPLRAYADHLATPEGRDALTDLLALALVTPTAVCCAESDWRSCHRRILADAVVLIGEREVRHLAHDRTVANHEPHPAARVVDGVVRYDRGQTPLWS